MNTRPEQALPKPDPGQLQAHSLSRNAWGQLVLHQPDGSTYAGVLAARAFPIQAPEHDISLLDGNGHELAWVADLASLPEPAQSLLRAALGEREFMPEILAILSVSSYSCPSTWQVRTERGLTSFVLKSDEDIRRLPGNALLVTDAYGIQFLIRDMAALGRDSRRLLERFK